MTKHRRDLAMPDDFDPYHRWLGIAPGKRPPDHYQLLGIPRFESDRDVISSAADRQMAHIRSLQSGKHAAATQRVLNELAVARVCLLSPEQKVKYDVQLQPTAPPPVPRPAEPTISLHVDTKQPRRSVRTPRPNTFVWIGMLAGIFTGIAATIFAVVILVPRNGKLAIEMSSGDRQLATLELDGTRRDIPPQGPLELTLPRGSHEIIVNRPLHARFQKTVEVVAGEATSLKVRLRPLARLTIEFTGRKPDNVKLSIDDQLHEVPAARSFVVPCEPGTHVIKAESPRGKFSRTVTVLPEQNFRVAVAILADNRLTGQWNGTIEINQKAVDQRLDQAKSNPLVRALVQQSIDVLRIGTLEIAMRADGTYDLTMKLGPIINKSTGRWAVTEEAGARATVELAPDQGPVEYRQFHFEGKDTFKTDLPKDLTGLGQFRCSRVRS